MDILKYKKACEDFERIFPEERARYLFYVSLDPNSNKNGYDIKVLSDPRREFRLIDPITSEKIEELHQHLMSLPGKKSKDIMLELTTA